MRDVKANRAARKYSQRAQLARVLWALAWPLFALSPRPLWGWRRALLRVFGAQIGLDVHIYPSVRVTMPWNLDMGDRSSIGARAQIYALGAVSIGVGSTVSQGAHLCAGSHDWRDPNMALTKPPIAVGDGVWICADAFIGPGVTLGDRVIAGARAVVMKDVAAGVI
ncbi:MAG: acetyltransferase, partial [Rhodobacteraceae bacterium]|nr:acetyltransferase [Paracoccaceae bacterium]